MSLPERDRELLERALDTLAGYAGCGTKAPSKVIRLYEKAIAVVRERPLGTRRLRSDFTSRRAPKHVLFPIDNETLNVELEESEKVTA